MLRRFFPTAYERKDPATAARTTGRLSVVYAFLGWNLFCVVFYMLWKKNVPDDKHERRKVLSRLNPEGVTHVIRGSGFTVKEKYSVEPEEVKRSGLNRMDQENVETL